MDKEQIIRDKIVDYVKRNEEMVKMQRAISQYNTQHEYIKKYMRKNNITSMSVMENGIKYTLQHSIKECEKLDQQAIPNDIKLKYTGPSEIWYQKSIIEHV